MSLSLVDYRSSSDSEDDDQPQQPQRQPGKQHTAIGARNGISQLLPPPENNKAPTKKSIFYLPSAVSDEDEDEKPSKRLKHGVTSSNLADLLPAPKNNLNPFRKPTTTATTTPTIPSPSTRSTTFNSRSADKTPLATHSSHQKDDDDNNNNDDSNNNNSESDDDQDDNDEQQESTKTTPSSKFTGSFFHIGSKLKDKPIVKPAKVASSSLKHSISNDDQQIQQQQLQPKYQEQQQQQQPPILEDPNAMYAFGADPNAYYQYYYQQQQQEEDASNKEMLDYNALSQLGGKRRGENAGVNIIDVNQTDILPSEEWRRQAEAQQPKFPLTSSPATFDVNSAKKKNNNIMALAAQAKSMESALEERYAQQRIAKNQARNRYGF